MSFGRLVKGGQENVPGAAATDDDIGLSVTDLRFRYRAADAPVLRGITFVVRPGEVLGVLGANGSGKSTLLAALSGMRRSHGDPAVARMDGHPLGRGASIGFATQDLALYRLLTVRENLLHTASLTLPRSVVDDAVARCELEFGLSDVATTRVNDLSGGWKRLAHIAASFVHRPALRLLDEPSRDLDFETRQRLVALVARWRTEGAATIVTSHYPEDIEEMCSTVLVIQDGRAVRTGSLADLLLAQVRELVVEAGAEPGAIVHRPAPHDVAGLVREVQAVAAERPGRTPLRDVRLTRRSLRDLLAQDPQLREVLDDGD